MIIWTLVMGGFLLVVALTAYARTRDSFHPAVVLAPMFGFLYVYLPLRLEYEDGFRGLLVEDDIVFAQQMNLAGVVALMIGIMLSARHRAEPTAPALTAEMVGKLRKGAVVLGIIGVLGYAVSIVNVGGISQAYGKAYGGGWSDSGYVRDSMLLVLPALILLSLVRDRNQKLRFWALVALFALPLAVQGFFGARRGPTFMAAAGIGIGHYLGNNKRPALLTLLGGGAALGFLLLFLVSNRQAIYVGSEKPLDQDASEYLRPGTGNEFIYGAGTVVHYEMTGRYMKGARYFAVFFVRPIPRAIWPTKYLWVSALFDVPNLEQNLGTDADSFRETLGWSGAVGAAPGLVADMFIEFGYLSPLALLLIGVLYGTGWRRATGGGGVWVPVYSLMLALSLYLVLQTLEAMAFRFLLTTVPLVIVWKWAARQQVSAVPVTQEALRV